MCYIELKNDKYETSEDLKHLLQYILRLDTTSCGKIQSVAAKETMRCFANCGIPLCLLLTSKSIRL